MSFHILSCLRIDGGSSWDPEVGTVEYLDSWQVPVEYEVGLGGTGAVSALTTFMQPPPSPGLPLITASTSSGHLVGKLDSQEFARWWYYSGLDIITR